MALLVLKIDHVNNIKIDNRLENLQLISNRENSTKESKNKTGFLGVYENGNKFISQIRIGENNIHLGVFETPELASNAYKERLKQLKNK